CFSDLRRARRAYRRREHDEWEVLADDPSWPGAEEAEQLRVLGQVCTAGHGVPNAEIVIYLAFRGTVSQENLATNLHAQLVPSALGTGNALVHRGFQDAYLALRTRFLGRLNAVLADLPALTPSAVLLRATGHSLGGALAMLACLDLVTCRGFAAECVTWGSPRVGDANFAALYAAAVPRTARFVNRFDVVPKLPANHQDEEAPGVLQRRLSAWLRAPQEHIGAGGYVHVCPAVELDSSLLASVSHLANVVQTARAAFSNVRSAAADHTADRMAVTMEEIKKSAEAMFPHRLDAYERNLEMFLRDRR
ncbi:unnamed protein product, partial [Symbiodinium natans]